MNRAEAGVLFPAPEEALPAESQLSPEAHAFSAAACNARP